MASDNEILNDAWAKRRIMRDKADCMRSESGQLLVSGFKLKASADIWWGVAVDRVYGNVPLHWHEDGSCTVMGDVFEAS